MIVYAAVTKKNKHFPLHDVFIVEFLAAKYKPLCQSVCLGLKFDLKLLSCGGCGQQSASYKHKI